MARSPARTRGAPPVWSGRPLPRRPPTTSTRPRSSTKRLTLTRTSRCPLADLSHQPARVGEFGGEVEADLAHPGDHHHGSANVAHHFDDAVQQHEAATLGMWTFLATEVLFFGGLFLGYSLYRHWYFEDFKFASEHFLKWPLGAINTGVLLVSSLTVALSVHA